MRMLLTLALALMLACDELPPDLPATPTPSPLVSCAGHLYVAPATVNGIENPDAGRLMVDCDLMAFGEGLTAARIQFWATPTPAGLPFWTGVTGDVTTLEPGHAYPVESVLNSSPSIEWWDVCGWHPQLGGPYIADGCVFWGVEVIP